MYIRLKAQTSLLAVVVHGAGWQDYDGAGFVLMRLQQGFRRPKVIFADAAYGKNGLPEWVASTFGWVLETVLRPVGLAGFVVLPKRWIVERTFAWISRCRRHSKDVTVHTPCKQEIGDAPKRRDFHCFRPLPAQICPCLDRRFSLFRAA